MSRHIIQNQERQTLYDLQQIFRPLIAKSISRDGATVSSLRVLNSWDIFEIEISQVLLYLKEDQYLSEDEHKDFQRNLHRLLSLMDKLVDEDVRTARDTVSSGRDDQSFGSVVDKAEHSMLGHQKLEALVRRAAEQEDSTSLALLFHLPTCEEQSIELEKAATNFNIENLRRPSATEQVEQDGRRPVEIVHHPKPIVGKSEPEKDTVDKPQDSTKALLRVLTEGSSRWTCGCVHAARLEVRDPVPSRGLYQGLRQQIFISRCRSTDEWQETYCEVISQLQTTVPQDPEVQRVHKICQAVERSFENRRKLDFLVHTGRLLQYTTRRPPDLLEQPRLWPVLSLEDILEDDASHYKPGDKIILAANLARALLRVHGGELTLRKMRAKEIFFLSNPVTHKVHDGHNPYLACSLVSLSNQQNDEIKQHGKLREPPRDEKWRENGISLKFPILVAFAELLMEIALGRKMGPYDCRVDIALLEEIGPNDYSGEITMMVGKDYVDVIIQCLEASQGYTYDIDSDSDPQSGSDSDSESYGDPNRGIRSSPKLKCRDKKEKSQENSEEAKERVCRDIIRDGAASLERHRKMFAPQTCPPLHFTVNNSGRAVALKGREPADKAGGQVPSGQSFDDMGLSVDRADQCVLWANTFFEHAQYFYNTKIRDLPVATDKRIRIAVLDTGVIQTSQFWRGRSHTRNPKDSPIRETKSFVGDPIDDEVGHGTNVAAIISKIAPESDLYIAKISRGWDTEGTQQIIEAIEWAMTHDVHIINMSFCLPKNDLNEEVRKTIEQATMFKGVIFVSAASNYGSNEARGFPGKLDQVICVHAMDGMGNKSGMNPPPEPRGRNFGSLGMGIKSEWHAHEANRYLEGTSYAAPVATGMISNVLRFVQNVRDEGLMTERYYKEAFSHRGMSNILMGMAQSTSEGYDYIRPRWKIWSEDDEKQHVTTKMQDALKKDMG